MASDPGTSELFAQSPDSGAWRVYGHGIHNVCQAQTLQRGHPGRATTFVRHGCIYTRDVENTMRCQDDVLLWFAAAT